MAGANTSQECLRVHSSLNDSRELLASKLTKALRKKINPRKAPPHFAEYLEKTCQAEGWSLSKTLLKADIIVYIAYFLAEENLEGVARLSTEDLALLTAEVISAPRDDTIDRFVTHFFKTSQRGKKFKAMVDSLHHELAMPSGSTSAYSTASTETARDGEHSTENDEAMHNQEHTTVNIGTTHNQEQSTSNIETTHNENHIAANNNYSGQHFTPLYKTIGFIIDTSKCITWPPVSSLSNVFPVYLTRIIVKTQNGNAWLQISYSDPTQSVMEMFVSASETQHIAKELFDLNVTTQKKARGVLLDNNVFLEMKDSITLSGSPIDKVRKLLGASAAQAYQNSSTRMEEVAQGLATITYCLAVEIWPDADSPSRLTLKADVATLSTIGSRLWPTFY